MTDRNVFWLAPALQVTPPQKLWSARLPLFNQTGRPVPAAAWRPLLLTSQSEFYLQASCLWNMPRHLKLVIMSRIHTYLKKYMDHFPSFLVVKETRRAAASYSCHYHSTFLFYCPSNMYRFNDLERDQWNSSQHCMFINEPPVHRDVLVSGLC